MMSRVWEGFWPVRAIFAGVAAALMNSAAIRLAQLSPVPPGTGGLAKMTLAFANQALVDFGFGAALPADFNPLVQEIFHTCIGVTMAMIYALFLYRSLSGPGWLRGLIYCQIMWLLQAFVVLPWTGAGVLGLRLSPFTPLLSFALNAVYGLVLGVLYRARK
ncbi:MAG: hypothetical protein ABR589_03865 [Chthoniobacterales bacterium]